MRRDDLKFPFHLILHPFDGFWDLKYEGKGRLRIALAILVLVVLTVILQRKFAGLLVNFNDPRYLNSLEDLTFTMLPFLLWCTANWAVSTLMDGEGKFLEIVTASGYALVPLVLIQLPMIYISRFMIMEETAFYYLLNTFAALWFVYLLFVGMMTIHGFTPGKTVLTMLLSVIVMGIIVFLGALVFSLLQQIYWFIINVYRELIFR